MYASILAGGSGTRLWPLSTKQSPKQFLRLPGPRTMLEETVERIAPLTALDQLYVVTFASYKDAVAEQIPDLPREQIVAEPSGRGTAASIGLAAALIAARDPQAVMGSFHADHVITDVAGFREALSFAEQLAREGWLVTLGVTPTVAETGYGYIQYGAPVGVSGPLTAYVGESFKEKPAREVAEQYLQAGNYVWNSGIFVWRVDRILAELRRYVPAVASVLDEIGAAARASSGRMTPDVERVMAAVWPRLTEIVTIDEGVLEKASGLVVIPVSVGWNDIGSWSQVSELHSADANGNAVVGLDDSGHIEIEAQGNLIYSSTGRTIAIAGANNLIVVDTPEGLLICKKDHAQHVKEIASFAQRRAERTER
jgi:mannose-1-phosphate guanylyltransferase